MSAQETDDAFEPETGDEAMAHAHAHEDEHGHEHERHHHVFSYEDAVRNYRAEKDAFFRTSSGSPIPEADRESFRGLPYFPIVPELRFEGLALEPYVGGEPVDFEIPTTDGRQRPAERAGSFRFGIDGRDLRLTAYRIAGGLGESLFVPFLDATTGRETYGAGRYLDLEPESDGSWTLDFNLAYHPSCVYDARYSCPLTPAENRLPVRIEAGERLQPDPG